jgi:iron(III) transport system ATP-binding protein
MNHGRIEQIAPPRELYDHPRTRFVAGFIGRTNFIEGSCDGQRISFDGFAVPCAAFARELPSAGQAVFAVRPHNMRLSATPPAEREGCTPVGVVVLERAFLGEHWDYIVRPRHGTASLRVMTSPSNDIQVGADAWLELEPGQMALIA